MPPQPVAHWGICTAVVAAVLFAAPAPSGAQPAKDPYAGLSVEKLYNVAATEMETGHYENACPKLEAVTRMAPDGIGARLTLAECYEGWGKLASAWSQYVAAEAMATKAGQAARVKKAAAKAAELKPKLATLAVQVPKRVASLPGLTILRDGVPMDQVQWDVPLAVDRGEHSVRVSAPGYEPYTVRIDVPSDGLKKTAALKALERESEPDPEPSATAVTPPPTETPTTGTSGSWQRPLGFAALSVGIVSIAIGALLGGFAVARNADSNRELCNAQTNVCLNEQGRELRRDALALGNGSTGMFVTGSLLTVSGIVLVLAAPSGAAPAPSGAAPAPGASQSTLLKRRGDTVLGISLQGIQVSGTW